MIICNAHIMDPASNLDACKDIRIDSSGRISEIVSPGTLDAESEQQEHIIDAKGMLVVPGFVDVHVHFRDPGFTYKEDIETGAAAAAAGGYTSVVCMANTKPAIDSVAVLRELRNREEKLPIHVYQAANVTHGMKGEEVVEFDALYEAGAAGFTDDGVPVMDENILEEALRACKRLDVPISLHEEDPAYVYSPGVNFGPVAEAVGVRGASAEAEYRMVERDVECNRKIGAKLDIQHISSAKTVEIIRKAKKEGVCVYAEATPQHLVATEELVRETGALARVNPPLRTEEDRKALVEGLRDGTIDLIATDHAPHSREEKERSIAEAPSGMIGLETAFGLLYTNLVKEEQIPLMQLIRAMTINPARLYDFHAGTLEVGSSADLAVIDLNEEWIVPDCFASKSANSPFIGRKLYGKIKYTICNGNIVYKD